MARIQKNHRRVHDPANQPPKMELAPTIHVDSLRGISQAVAVSNNLEHLFAVALLPESDCPQESIGAKKLLELACNEYGIYDKLAPPGRTVYWRMLQDLSLRGLLVRQEGGFRKTPLGDVACAVGANILSMCLEYEYPTRRLVGDTPDRTRNPVVQRALTWDVFTRLAGERIVNGDMMSFLTQHGVSASAVDQLLREAELEGMVRRDFRDDLPHYFKLGYVMSETGIPSQVGASYVGYLRGICGKDWTDRVQRGLVQMDSMLERLRGDEIADIVHTAAVQHNPHLQRAG